MRRLCGKEETAVRASNAGKQIKSSPEGECPIWNGDTPNETVLVSRKSK